MDRLHLELAPLDNYQPLQIDSLLFTQDERDSFEVAQCHAAGKLNNPRQKRFDRLNWLQTSAAFSGSIWFYQLVVLVVVVCILSGRSLAMLLKMIPWQR